MHTYIVTEIRRGEQLGGGGVFHTLISIHVHQSNMRDKMWVSGSFYCIDTNLWVVKLLIAPDVIILTGVIVNDFRNVHSIPAKLQLFSSSYFSNNISVHVFYCLFISYEIELSSGDAMNISKVIDNDSGQNDYIWCD
jgi:hypothetical protein